MLSSPVPIFNESKIWLVTPIFRRPRCFSISGTWSSGWCLFRNVPYHAVSWFFLSSFQIALIFSLSRSSMFSGLFTKLTLSCRLPAVGSGYFRIHDPEGSALTWPCPLLTASSKRLMRPISSVTYVFLGDKTCLQASLAAAPCHCQKPLSCLP